MVCVGLRLVEGEGVLIAQLLMVKFGWDQGRGVAAGAVGTTITVHGVATVRAGVAVHVL